MQRQSRLLQRHVIIVLPPFLTAPFDLHWLAALATGRTLDPENLPSYSLTAVRQAQAVTPV